MEHRENTHTMEAYLADVFTRLNIAIPTEPESIRHNILLDKESRLVLNVHYKGRWHKFGLSFQYKDAAIKAPAFLVGEIVQALEGK